MDGSNPGSRPPGCSSFLGSGGYGGECKKTFDCDCAVCTMWEDIRNHYSKSDGSKKQFLAPASDGSSSSGSGSGCGGEFEMSEDGAKQFPVAASDGSRDTSETSGDSVNIVGPPPHAVIDLSSSDEDDIMREGTGKSGSGGRKPHDLASVEKLGVGSAPQSSNHGGPSEHPYIVPRFGTPLPKQAEKKIKEKVQAIGSQVPIYVKVMTKSSVPCGHNCAVVGFCSEYASEYLPEESTTAVLQVEGEQTQWMTTMDVRPDNWTYIYIGWKEFAVKNNLKVGDICLFQLASKRKKSLTMKVHVIRKSEVEP